MKNKILPSLLVGLLCFLAGLFFNFSKDAETITSKTIDNALQLSGLEFSASEIDSMKSDVEEYLQSYKNNRSSSIPNATSPALTFNPIPIGFKKPTEQKEVVFSTLSNFSLPTNKNELAFFTVRQLAELLRTQKITSVELTQFFINRLKKYDPELHCVITITEELAMQQAKRADTEIKAGNYKGLLHGIPYGAKDLLATKTYKTTWGATPYKEQTFDYDATVIQKLEEAGAVLIAKTTLGALAWGDVWYGERTRNPWDTTRGSSGSSAGSASAVAAGLLPFAIGTETLGSIVSPSTVCGTTGLRPTFGRVSKHGAMALSWSMDKIGPICRSVEDAAIVFDAIRGADDKDLSVIEAPFNFDATNDLKGLKVGYLKSAFENNYAFKSQDSLSLVKLKDMGVELTEIELPDMPDIVFILQAEAAAAFDELTLSNQDDLMVRQIKNAWPNVFRAARTITAVEYIKANRLRTQLMEDMQKVFEQVDVYVHPSWASSSLRITNLTGHPCVVLPNGFRNGRPTSISFTGQLFDEASVMHLAKAYQDATDWNEQHPKDFLQ